MECSPQTSLGGSPPLFTSTSLGDMCRWCLWKGFIEVRLWDREYFQNFTPSYLRQAASGKRHYWLKNCSAWAVLCVHWVVWTMQWPAADLHLKFLYFIIEGHFMIGKKGQVIVYLQVPPLFLQRLAVSSECNLKKWSSSCKSFFTRLPWCIRLNARRWFFPPAISSNAVQSHAAAAAVQRSLGFCT